MMRRLLSVVIVALGVTAPVEAQEQPIGVPEGPRAGEHFEAFWQRELEGIKSELARLERLQDITSRTIESLEVELADNIVTEQEVEDGIRELNKTAIEGLMEGLKGLLVPAANDFEAAKQLYEAGKLAYETREGLKSGMLMYDQQFYDPDEANKNLILTIDKRRRQFDQRKVAIDRLRDGMNAIQEGLDQHLRDTLLETNAALQRSQAETERVLEARRVEIAAEAPEVAAEMAAERARYLERRKYEESMRMMQWLNSLGGYPGGGGDGGGGGAGWGTGPGVGVGGTTDGCSAFICSAISME